MLFLLVFSQIFSIDFKEDEKIKKIFMENKAQGTFVLYDESTNEFIGYNKERAEELFYPASTFKIYNSLIGLNSGAVKDTKEIFYKYDGEKVYLKSWERDSNLEYAMKVSQVPAYQLLAKKIGMKEMKKQIDILNFGNKEIGNKIDKFWLEGPLKVSAIDQVELLNKLGNGRLPYPIEIQREVQNITILEKGSDWILHGKTGWATNNIKIPVGWFVGWVEKNGKIYSFALNMDLKESSKLPKREEIAKKALKSLNIL
ncbi:MAG: class D beta-lactamase [Cetobacterium sp.]|uniref:class D beta-lactamase n=1 Tax=Cetobacterium sp. TaxID=2071632 RepID=UPI003F38FDC3